MRRQCGRFGLVCIVALSSACLTDVVEIVDAGHAIEPRVVDAGGASADAPRTSHVADPLAFRFARMRTPTAGGEEIVRIGLHERVRLVDGILVEERSAPSAEALAKLVDLCARRDVEEAVRPPGDTAPSMTTIELGCAPVQGVVACEPAVASTCSGAFVDVKDAVTAAWHEDGDATRTPGAGLTVRVAQWTGAQATVLKDGRAAPALVLWIDGKAMLPAKGEPFARAPSRKRVTLCGENFGDACTDAVAPALVHVDVVNGEARFRCPSCAPAKDPRPSPRGAQQLEHDPSDLEPDGTLTRAHILEIVKGEVLPRVTKECARAAGPDVVKLSWTIQPSGQVTDVHVASADGDSARGRCAVALMRRIKFARSTTSTPVSFPIRIGR